MLNKLGSGLPHNDSIRCWYKPCMESANKKVKNTNRSNRVMKQINIYIKKKKIVNTNF